VDPVTEPGLLDLPTDAVLLAPFAHDQPVHLRQLGRRGGQRVDEEAVPLRGVQPRGRREHEGVVGQAEASPRLGGIAERTGRRLRDGVPQQPDPVLGDPDAVQVAPDRFRHGDVGHARSARRPQHLLVPPAPTETSLLLAVLAVHGEQDARDACEQGDGQTPELRVDPVGVDHRRPEASDQAAEDQGQTRVGPTDPNRGASHAELAQPWQEHPALGADDQHLRPALTKQGGQVEHALFGPTEVARQVDQEHAFVGGQPVGGVGLERSAVHRGFLASVGVPRAERLSHSTLWRPREKRPRPRRAARLLATK
jgi:hypothetical protein